MTQTVLLGDLMAEKGYIRGPFGSALRRPEMKSEGIPVYEQQNAIYNHRDFRFFIDDQKHEELKRFTVKPGDLLISCSGTLGKITIIRPEDPIGIISQALLILRVDPDKVLPEYLYYFLSSGRGQRLLLGASHGSVQTNIAKRAVVEAIKIDLPSLPEQKKIADIIGTIDEKIELNRQMNETLEQVGQALFRHYFIDNPETEKWREETLGDIIELRGGLSYKASFLSDDVADTPMVTMGCVSGKYRINLGALKYYSGEYKEQHILNSGDMFIATRDVTQDRVLIGSPAIIPESLGQAICATNLYRVIKKQDISTEFLYQLMRTRRYREQIIANAKGSTIVMLTKDSVLNYTFRTDFDSTSYQEYIQHAEVLRQKIDRNFEEIQTLATLRDTLLPRLISGKVKV